MPIVILIVGFVVYFIATRIGDRTKANGVQVEMSGDTTSRVFSEFSDTPEERKMRDWIRTQNLTWHEEFQRKRTVFLKNESF